MKEKADTLVTTILKDKYKVFLSPDYQFYAVVAGKNYSAPSLAQLTSKIASVVKDTTFSPDKIELKPLDTAALEINGNYKDHLRYCNITIKHKENKEYELFVRGGSRTGRQNSKDFIQATDELEDAIFAEIEDRLTQNEWVKSTKQQKPHTDQWGKRYGRKALWENPKAVTRITSEEIHMQLCEFLKTIFDIDDESFGPPRLRLRTDETNFQLRNGQKFTIYVSENL